VNFVTRKYLILSGDFSGGYLAPAFLLADDDVTLT